VLVEGTNLLWMKSGKVGGRCFKVAEEDVESEEEPIGRSNEAAVEGRERTGCMRGWKEEELVDIFVAVPLGVGGVMMRCTFTP